MPPLRNALRMQQPHPCGRHSCECRFEHSLQRSEGLWTLQFDCGDNPVRSIQALHKDNTKTDCAESDVARQSNEQKDREHLERFRRHRNWKNEKSTGRNGHDALCRSEESLSCCPQKSLCRDDGQTQVFAVLGSYILRKAPDVGSFVALE